jgi:phosphoribosylamine-glycine ligase
VVAVTAVASSLLDARRRAYEAASLITFEGKVMRSDIARDVV